MKSISPRQLAFTYSPVLLVLAAAAAASRIFRVDISTMMADRTASAHIHPLTGAVSSLGILGWCATASICFFAAAAMRRDAPRESRAFLLASALLTSYLMIDDLFQFHETLAPRYLGLSESFVYAALGATVCAYLVAFRRILLSMNLAMLAAAVGFLGVSVGLDAILAPWLGLDGPREFFAEDGAKLLGIASWCSYFSSASLRLLAGTTAARTAAAAEPAVLSGINEAPPA